MPSLKRFYINDIVALAADTTLNNKLTNLKDMDYI